MSKPASLPAWNTGLSNNVEPSSGRKIAGFATGGDTPGSGELNWLFKLGYDWFVWLDGFLGETHTFTKGMIITQSVSNTAALTTIGNGNAAGVNANGGNNGGHGITGTGGANGGAGVLGVGGTDDGDGGFFTGTEAGHGVSAQGGVDNGRGGSFTGGGAGDGIRATGGSADGDGVKGVGGGSNGNGGVFDGVGTGSGLVVGTGYLRLNGTNPVSTTAFSNKVTPTNTVKAWARVNTAVAGAPVVSGGFNIASVAFNGDNLEIILASNWLSAASVGVLVSPGFVGSSNWAAVASGSNKITVNAVDSATGTAIPLSGLGVDVHIVVFCTQ